MPTTFQDTGGHAKLLKLFEGLRARIPEEALRPTAMEIAVEVASRAPTPEQEYRTMMYGSDGFLNGVADTQPRVHGVSPTAEDNRVRFIKPDENYLRNYLPTSFTVDGLYAGIGNIPELDAISSYSYVNLDGQNKSWEHAVTEPFWRAWEYGGMFLIRPRNFSGRRGRGYPLRPTPSTFAWQMTKFIPARNMFFGVDKGAVCDEEFWPRVLRIVRSL